MDYLNNTYIHSAFLKKSKNFIIFLIIVVIFDFFLFPMPTLADEAVRAETNNNRNLLIISENTDIVGQKNENSIIVNIPQQEQPASELPQNKPAKTKKIGNYVVTAYNSEVGQTDDSPCITANGFNLCQHGVEDTIAANFLPFGARVRMPELFGERVFVVRDRMNFRHSHRVDVWMLKKQDARKFGVKNTKIEVLE